MYSVFTVDATTLPALKEQALNVHSSALWDAGLETSTSRRFVAEFERKYKRTPSLYAAVGFDAANLLDAAIRRAGNRANDRGALNAAIKAAATDFPTVRGTFSFNNNNADSELLRVPSHQAGRPRRSRQPWTLERVYGFFPRLQERRRNLGSQLSGGEQQMLVIGRALMTNPRLLVLDEATEGLAPLIRLEIWQALGRLKQEGLAQIVIDKNIGHLLGLADRHVVIEKGRVVWHGDSNALRAEPHIVEQYLGI